MNFNKRTKSYRSNSAQTLLANKERTKVIMAARADAKQYLNNEFMTPYFLFKKHQFNQQYENLYKLVFMLKQTALT